MIRKGSINSLMRISIPIFLTYLFWLLQCITSIQGQLVTNSVDKNTLVDMYDSFINKPSWNLSSDPCQNNATWIGITCILLNAQYRVQSIYLYKNNTQGKLPSSLGNFSSLVELVLSSNSISGTIPLSIGNISSLITLDLSYNRLTGFLYIYHT